MKPAETVCRVIAAGACVTGVVMVLFLQDVQATSDHFLVDSVVHVSNVKFMAAMWVVVGLIFAAGASHLDNDAAWSLLRIACVGISAAAVVRIVEMVRLDDFSPYGSAAAAVELVVPGWLIYLRRQQYPGVDA